MTLLVLVTNEGQPITGSINNDKNFHPAGVMPVKTANGPVHVPLFDKEYMCINNTRYIPVQDFLVGNRLITSANGVKRNDFHLLFTKQAEDLDEMVYNLMMFDATTKMNEEEDENEQENILKIYEQKASDINNAGLESQLLFILTA